jgi:hypothetical protein
MNAHVYFHARECFRADVSWRFPGVGAFPANVDVASRVVDDGFLNDGS